MDITNHWTYFLSLELDFNNSLRYVEYTKAQESVFSHEFARLILSICSEIDVLCKVICDHIKSATNTKSDDYYNIVTSKYDIKSEEVNIDRYGLNIYPYKGWTKNKVPQWWTAYNKVKHERHNHFEKANLGNTLHAISGLFIMNLIAFNEYDNLSNLFSFPSLLGRDESPGVLRLESSYTVKLTKK